MNNKNTTNTTKSSSKNDDEDVENQNENQNQNHNTNDKKNHLDSVKATPLPQLPSWIRLMWDNPALHVSKRDILFPPLPDGEVLKRYAPAEVLRNVQAQQNARIAEMNKKE